MMRTGAALTVAMVLATSAGAAEFAGPQEALDALVAAADAGEPGALLAVLGDEAQDLIADTPEERQENRAAFLALYGEGYRFLPVEDGVVEVLLGADGWPFAIPLVKGETGWSFDVAAGREELLAREIGFNELEVIALMDVYGDLQAAFRLRDHDGDGVLEFARSVISSADARDGLFWPGDGSLVGARLAMAAAHGWSDGEAFYEPEPHFGYVFRILQGQGDSAPGGAMSYLVNDRMVAGHALLAVPASYGETGVHSFMVAENGVILEADLGPETADRAADITLFAPDADWAPLE